MNLEEIMQVMRLRWIAVTVMTLLGLGAGIGYSAYNPPLLTSNAMVQLSTANAATMTAQTVTAGSPQVLGTALPDVAPKMTLNQLRPLVKISSLSNSILLVSASGKTSHDAEQTAGAVRYSYLRWGSGARQDLQDVGEPVRCGVARNRAVKNLGDDLYRTHWRARRPDSRRVRCARTKPSPTSVASLACQQLT